MRREQVRHCLLKSAAGDALGYAAEASRKKLFSGLHDFKAGKGTKYNKYYVSVKAGDYTDDTEYTLAVAKSIAGADLVNHSVMEAQLAYYTQYGTTGGKSMKEAGRKISMMWGSIYDRMEKMFESKGGFPYWEQKGTGVLMRVSPLALALGDSSLRVNSVYENGVLTHGSAEALFVSVVYCELLRGLYESPNVDLRDVLKSVLERDLTPGSDLMKEWSEHFKYHTGLDFKAECEEVRKELMRELGNQITFGSQKCLDSFLAAVELSDMDLVECAKFGKGVGMDIDTVTALVGQLQGVRISADDLDELESKVQDSGYISQIAGNLYDIEHHGLKQDAALRDDWRREMAMNGGLWHPIFGKGEVISEEKSGRYLIKRIGFEDGKTMVIRLKS